MARAVTSTLAWALRMLVRWSSAQVGLALCYHRIAERGGDASHEVSAALSLREFERHLRHLRRRYQVVPASGLMAATARRRRGGRLTVAITFDDDLPSHVTCAAPALQRRALPATFFLSGAGLAGPFSFWWQLLQRAWDRGLVNAQMLQDWGVKADEVTVRALARSIQAMRPAERYAASAALRAALGGDCVDDTLSRDAVEALAAAGFEIGFHTIDHHDLTALAADELDPAMWTGRAELEQVVGCTSMISYPHGRADARVAAAARAAGFRFGFVVDGTAVSRDSDPHLLGRRYPARGSRGRFELDVARTLLNASPRLRARRRR